MRRALADGYEIDDDPARVDLGALHRFLSEESYWARGRGRADVERAVAASARVVAIYSAAEMVAFARAVSDGVAIAYLADVYVETGHRGRGLGVAVVAEIVDGPPLAHVRWVLRTDGAEGLYARLGFRPGHEDDKLMFREWRAESAT